MANQKISQLEPIGTIDINQDSIPIVDYSENLTKRTNLANIGQRVLEGSTTTNLAEGTNLYFTNTRVYTKVKASLIAGSNTSITFNDALQTITIASQGNVQSVNTKTGAVVLTTTDINEGTNEYFTAARVRAVVLTGLSLVTNAVISATDSVVVAFGKLQAQITANANATLTALGLKQDTLVSGTNIKTINGDSVLGSGDIVTSIQLSYRHDFNVFDYLGKAASGSSESANVWTITRLTIASNGSVTKGVATNVNWTDRYTHIYS
jgi:hypothetical protein